MNSKTGISLLNSYIALNPKYYIVENRMKLTPLIAEAIIRAAKKTSSTCMELGLHCYDPPVVISPLLRCLGYNEYQVRRFWRYFEEGGEINVEVYRYLEAQFNIISVYKKETVSHIRYSCVPVDSLDCHKLGSECIKTPHTHALYLYVDGRVGNAEIRMNIIRLLSLLYSIDRRVVDSLLDSILDMLWNRINVEELYNRVLDALNLGDHVLRVALPLKPDSKEKLLQLSPILRRIQQ